MIDNTIHKLEFKRPTRLIYGARYSVDSDIILVDTEILEASKTHDTIKL